MKQKFHEYCTINALSMAKKTLATLLLALTGFGLFAQKVDKAKDLLAKNKVADAKTEIDNVLTNEKNQANPEAWYTKAKVYLAVANDANLKTTVPEARDAAFTALKKYLDIESKEKEAGKRNMLLTLDNNQPLIDLYTGYSKDAASFYNANNFNDALNNFKKCLEIFDTLSHKNVIPAKFDTTTTLYAGISAEKANKLDEAAVYYGQIAEHKVKAEGYAEIYKWLADHYKQKSDVNSSLKFLRLGQEVYPQDPFWSEFELNLLREKAPKDSLFTKYEDVIKKSPDNHLYWFNYGVELYQTGYDADITKRPANSKELIQRAQEKIAKSIELKPDYPNSQMVMGQMLYNQGVDLTTEAKAIKTPAGGKLKPEDAKKKDDLKKEAMAKFDAAIPYFMKVDELLGKSGKLKMEERSILKDALDLLITIYEQKGNQKAKVDEYTEKFNDVDKKH